MTLFPDDVALAKAMLRGDALAFDRFYRELFPRLYRFMYSRTKEADKAEEYCQASLVRAIEKLDQYRGEASLLTWLFTIARNEYLAHARREQRFETIAHEESEATAHFESARMSPEAAVQHEQDRSMVHAILDRLPPLYAECLEWKYTLGLSMHEIAQRLGRTEKAVEGLLSRARNEFKALLDAGAPALPPRSPR